MRATASSAARRKAARSTGASGPARREIRISGSASSDMGRTYQLRRSGQRHNVARLTDLLPVSDSSALARVSYGGGFFFSGLRPQLGAPPPPCACVRPPPGRARRAGPARTGSNPPPTVVVSASPPDSDHSRRHHRQPSRLRGRESKTEAAPMAASAMPCIEDDTPRIPQPPANRSVPRYDLGALLVALGTCDRESTP